MSDTLRDVWREVENLLNAGINVIAVRDKDDYYNGKTYAAKTPYAEWKKYQNEFIDRAILWNEMNDRGTTAVAMVCGAISGNLEIVDIEVKYYPGIDARITQALIDLYPDIFERIRVNKTKNNGIHLVYRISDHEVPPSTQLAHRDATDEELIMNPKRKTRCFAETRGTGGLATAPPSLGYAIRKNVPIQSILWEERCSIIELVKSFNEVIKEEKPYTPPKSEISYYDENPFEHYNRTVDPRELLESCGWSFVRKSGAFLWFTKPGGRKGDVHGGFNTEKNTYRIWSTDAGIDSERSYTPSTILAFYKFNEDKSKTYHHLVEQGFGRIKPALELKLAKKKAIEGVPMPTNASPEALATYQTISEQVASAHPHGIFWEPDPDRPDTFRISRLGFKQVATGLGFRWHKGEVIQINLNFIHRRDERFFFDSMREYIKEDDPDLYETIYNATQSFLQKNGKFEITQLDFLDESVILSDTRSMCYKFFQNGYVQINAHGYSILSYENISQSLVWFEKVQSRSFNMVDTDCLYCDFLRLACDLDTQRDHVMSVVGWLAHDYKSENTAYIITLTEQCADPKDGGGSGKNLFCNLLQHSTTVKTIPANRKFDQNNLLQAWAGEKVYVLSDPDRDFDWGVLKEPSSGNAIHKRLFKDERRLSIQDVPKFVVPTNFSYEITDGGLKRRIVALEFTNFFTNVGGVDVHYGKHFPDDWASEDWAGYDNFICQSIQHWISCGLKLKHAPLTETGWEKQFQLTYGALLHEFIKENWEDFRKGNFIPNTEFTRLFDQFAFENNFRLKPSMLKINNALEAWARKHDMYLLKSERRRNLLGSQDRGRMFSETPF